MLESSVTNSNGANWKLKTSLSIVLILLAVYRLLLSRSGQLYWPDEYRYLHAVHFMDELHKGNPSAGLKWIFGSAFDVAARPGFMLLATIPVFLQGLAHLLLGVQPSDAAFYRIPAMFNVVISLGVAILFYRILFVLSGDRTLALLGMVIHGLLVNTNLYVRHLFPYDWSLLIVLAALNVILSLGMARDRPRYQAAVAGLLTGIGTTTYTPFYPIIIILIAALIVAQNGRWRHMPTFAVAILSIMTLWEGIARIGGFSFIGASFEYATYAFASQDVQGAFEEGYRFLPLYLLEIEGITGAMLLALFACFWVGVVKGQYGRMEVAIIGTATAVYLFYGTMGVVFHRSIVLGRLLHMYFPFVVLASVLAVKIVPGSKLRMGLAGILMVASAASFVPTAANALATRYPRDVERELVASLAPGTKICSWVRDGTGEIEEPAIQCTIADAKALVIRYPRDVERGPAALLTPRTKICGRVKDNRDGIEEPASDCDLVLDNFRHLYPPSLEIVDAAPPPGFVLNAAYDHPLQFAPYWFEGFRPDERARLAARQPKMRVYARAVLRNEIPTTGGAARASE